ncbi:hypothetical protein NRIC_14880 [Enterococcus florum]|uniref:Uncharacterized protein n=1 Tax=Enterococcus florum TaxID=2480627 RepID=A0A4P5P6Q0_9ENTE|nr:hypothetical protein [Enterococcus florum]GCF93597.1 hypothetical protein NRIC_14880 [Enterococcus florum]
MDAFRFGILMRWLHYSVDESQRWTPQEDFFNCFCRLLLSSLKNRKITDFEEVSISGWSRIIQGKIKRNRGIPQTYYREIEIEKIEEQYKKISKKLKDIENINVEYNGLEEHLAFDCKTVAEKFFEKVKNKEIFFNNLDEKYEQLLFSNKGNPYDIVAILFIVTLKLVSNYISPPKKEVERKHISLKSRITEDQKFIYDLLEYELIITDMEHVHPFCGNRSIDTYPYGSIEINFYTIEGMRNLIEWNSRISARTVLVNHTHIRGGHIGKIEVLLQTDIWNTKIILRGFTNPSSSLFDRDMDDLLKEKLGSNENNGRYKLSIGRFETLVDCSSWLDQYISQYTGQFFIIVLEGARIDINNVEEKEVIAVGNEEDIEIYNILKSLKERENIYLKIYTGIFKPYTGLRCWVLC